MTQLRPSGEGGHPRRWVAGAAAASSIVAAIVGVLALTRDVANYTIPHVNVSTQIHVDWPRNNMVQRCMNLTGSAEYKDEADLWVAIAAKGSGRYYVKPAAQIPGSDRWTVPDVIFGLATNPEEYYEVYIFYLPRDFSDFIKELHGNPQERLWAFRNVTSLPRGVGDPDKIVSRDSRNLNKDCPP